MSEYLTTSQAAKVMGIPEEAVRSLCKAGILSGALQKQKGAPWQIPQFSVETWLRQQKSTITEKVTFDNTVTPPIFWQRFSNNPWIFYPSLLIGGVAALLTFIFGFIQAGASYEAAKKVFQEWEINQSISVAEDQEVLIVIATFYISNGVIDHEIHQEIRRAIQYKKDKLKLENIRVEVTPIVIRPEDRDKAVELGKQLHASMIIWGADTGVRIVVNYLSFQDDNFPITELEITDSLANLAQNLSQPEPYAHFITEELPSQLSFLSLFAIGHSYSAKGDYKQAITTIETAIDSLRSPLSLQGVADAYFRLGWLYDITNEFDKEISIQHYSKAISFRSNYAEAYHNRSLNYLETDKDLLAFNDLQKLVELKPKTPYPYIARAFYYTKHDDYIRAIADLNYALRLDPNNGLVYINRSNVFALKGDLSLSIDDAEQAIKVWPNSEHAYASRASAYYSLGEYKKALDDYNHSIKLQPSFATAYLNIGVIHISLGNNLQAISEFTKAIALEPNMERAYLERGIAYDNLGYSDKAIVDLTHAIQLRPNNHKAYRDRGLAYYNQGRFEQAINDYNYAIQLKPDYVVAYYERGQSNTKTSKYKQAVEDFNKVILLQPNNIDAYYERGYAYAQINSFREALSDLNYVIQNQPNYALAYYGRGFICEKLGQKAEAISNYNDFIKLSNDQEWILKAKGKIRDIMTGY